VRVWRKVSDAMRMSRRMRGLLAVNAVLLCVLLVTAVAPLAEAQRARRAPGEYTMVAARAQGISEEAIYIVDSTNMEMLVVRYNRSTKRLDFIGFRDLQNDFDEVRGPRRR
jgi:hypothetical protein